MCHAFHQSEGLKVDRDGSAQSAVTQPCIHIRDWTESLSSTQADFIIPFWLVWPFKNNSYLSHY